MNLQHFFEKIKRLKPNIDNIASHVQNEFDDTVDIKQVQFDMLNSVDDLIKELKDLKTQIIVDLPEIINTMKKRD